MESVGLYLHFPFCKAKCLYCDFASEASQEELIAPYLAALQTEMGYYRGISANTVYLGGGTPSLMSPDQLASLVAAIHANFQVMPGAEITMEANPGTGSPDLWAAAHQAGVNRISLGSQSFCDRLLQRIGRIHGSEAIKHTLRDLRAVGFDNISLDLMYGLPGQSIQDWEESLTAALSLAPKHLSLYALSVEEGTPFHREQQLGTLDLPVEEIELQMADIAERILSEGGYQRYEIASWALPGYESRHNLGYWRLDPYVGLGTGAHSYYQHRRYAHPRGIQAYLKDPLPHPPEAPLPIEEEMEEFMFLGLRMLQEGVRYEDFERRFGRTLEAVYGAAIDRLRLEGKLSCENGKLTLTKQAIMVANDVFMEFLSPNT